MTSTPKPTFYPPQLNPLLIGLGQWCAPILGEWRYKFQVVTNAESLERLRSQRDQRLILLPNHSCFDDPPVIFTLGGRVGLRFHYMAALELFQGALGVWLQRLGVYSIRRGFADRTSIAFTLDLIAQPDSKLVIFAEGGCSFQNDSVMPFRPGAIQMAFQVLNRFHKRGEPLPDLWVAPVGIKYYYKRDLTPVFLASLQVLEQELQLPSLGNPLQRLCQIAQQRLVFWETTFGLQPANPKDWDERIEKLKKAILIRAEQQLQLETNGNDPDRDRAYRVLNALANLDAQAQNQPQGSISAQILDRAVRQVLNYINIYADYIAENPSQERFLDTLTRLERDVFQIDQPRPKGDRIAYVQVGELLNLKNWFEQYCCDRNAVIEQLSQSLRSQVQDQINLICQEYPTQTVYLPDQGQSAAKR